MGLQSAAGQDKNWNTSCFLWNLQWLLLLSLKALNGLVIWTVMQMSPCINSLSRGKGSLDCSRLSFPLSPDATTRWLSFSEFLTIHASYLLTFHVAASCSVLHGNIFLLLLNLIRLLTCPLFMHALTRWLAPKDCFLYEILCAQILGAIFFCCL